MKALTSPVSIFPSMAAWRRADPGAVRWLDVRLRRLHGRDTTYAADRARSDRGDGKNEVDAMSAGNSQALARAAQRSVRAEAAPALAAPSRSMADEP